MLQNKLRILSSNDLQEKGWLLKSGYKKDQSLLTLPLDFSPASIISILQNTTEHKRSLPAFVCSNSLTGQFRHYVDQLGTSVPDELRSRLGVSVFFSKANGERISAQMKKLSFTIRKKSPPTYGCKKEGFILKDLS